MTEPSSKMFNSSFAAADLLPPASKPAGVEAAFEHTFHQQRKTTGLYKLRYQPELVAKLKADHRIFMQQYHAVLTAAKAKDYSGLPVQLKGFTAAVKQHFAEDYKDVYIFVIFFAKKYYVEDKDLLRQQSMSMQRDAATVINLLNQYERQPVDAQRVDRFIADFENIGSMLVDRIAVEESIIYPRYDQCGRTTQG